MELYRQGDVLIIKVDEAMPDGAKPAPANRLVLAEGEVTGHAHAIYAPVGVKVLDMADVMWIEATQAVTVKHEEHAPVQLPAGVYKVVHQREYSPQEIRRVLD